MKKNILILLLTFLSIFTATSQDFTSAELDSLFLVLDENDRFMGSLAIAHKGQPVYTKAVGYTDVLTEIKTDTDTKFRIGSISKTFTAALIFKAIENGKLNLDDTISGYFPNVPNANSITIRNLLNHRSGIYNFTNNPLYLSWNTTSKSKEELIKIIIGGGSVFEPNSKAEYSNSNYVLLTFMLETVFEKSYPALIAEYITEPLQLNSTYFGGKIAIKDNEANSYQYTKGWKKQTETDMSVPLGAGAIVSNPTDLNTFMKALFDGDIISKERVATMITLKENYGMGIFQVPFGEKKGYGHTGGIDGFSSVVYYFPADEVSISLTSNGNRFRNNDIIIAGLSAFYGMPITIPNFESVQLTTEQLASFIGVYSSEQFPLKINITQENGTLYGQATGQPSFPLDAKQNDTFEFLPAGVQLEFKSSENTMILKQGGGEFKLAKEE